MQLFCGWCDISVAWRLLAYFGELADILCFGILDSLCLTVLGVLQANFRHTRCQQFNVTFLWMRHYTVLNALFLFFHVQPQTTHIGWLKNIGALSYTLAT